MKRILSVVLLTWCAIFLLSSVAVGQQTPPPPPPPKAPKTEKHIKMVKVGDDGKKVELDTVISGDQFFVWQGDTVGGKELKWISKDEFKMDSIHQNFDMNFEYEIKDDGEGNVMIFKSGKDGDHVMMVPPAHNAPFPPHVMMMRAPKNKNVIDLSDPGIISYDKKIQKDGTEKITIVRKQVEEKEEDMIFDGPASGNMMWYGDAPGHTKTVKVIKSDDGSTQIFEDDKVIELKGEKGEATFIKDNGEVIHLKEIKEGDQKKIEVTVKEEKEKK
jgi:hypothetical protein